MRRAAASDKRPRLRIKPNRSPPDALHEHTQQQASDQGDNSNRETVCVCMTRSMGPNTNQCAVQGGTMAGCECVWVCACKRVLPYNSSAMTRNLSVSITACISMMLGCLSLSSTCTSIIIWAEEPPRARNFPLFTILRATRSPVATARP